MSLWVALETSTRTGSIALRDGERSEQRILAADRPHATDLLPALDELLTACSRDPLDIEGVVIATGPGSYTGLRVGIATALGLAHATRAELVAIPSVAALAHGELAPGEEATILANAHAGALYVARYRREESGVTELSPPSVAPRNEAIQLAAHTPGRILADPASAKLLREANVPSTRLTVDAMPRASALLELGLLRHRAHGPTPAEAIEPLYLRPFRATVRKR